MTPIEQDKELLEKQIHKLFGDYQAERNKLKEANQ